jgi:hypothetical protein
MGLVNETVHAFNSEYNLGKDTAKGLMPYCRPAVEKYVFSKVTFIQSLFFHSSFTINSLRCMQ